MKKLLPMLLALLCACEAEPPAPPPSFHILSISPTEQSALEAKDVIVELDVEPRFLVDFNTRSARMLEKPELRIGTWTVPLARYLGRGQFQGTVPPGLDVDTYDVQVSLGDGREATLTQAYTVTPYLSYWIESIGDQLQGKPFAVTIHAGGPSAERFTGTVTIVIYQDGSPILSIPSNPFSEGLVRQEITIDAVGNTFNVGMVDEKGSTASSNSFRVLSKKLKLESHEH
ncbi:hypothetical protein [Archangium lipolyticum]|uniref:hypothetical protein n=1 Tax=Archangium lipolyticum TaxID=2970465 RepID=UPI002149E87B|nr:hypothetical protein [Archangium lipolyticum]